MFTSYKVVTHSEIKADVWNTFLKHHVQSDVFHTPYIFEVFTTVSTYSPFAFFAVTNIDEIHGIFCGFEQSIKPGFLKSVSTRSVMMSGGIYDNPKALEALLAYYTSLDRLSVNTEIRNHVSTCDVSSIYTKFGFKFDDHFDIIICLDKSEDELFNSFHPSRRKQIKRGYRSGCETIIVNNNDGESLSACIKIVQDLYVRLKLPGPSKEMLMAAARLSSISSRFLCFAIVYRNEIIGTRMVLCFKDKIFDWYAGSKEEHYDKYPNDILPWEVMKWGQKNGYKTFDFGGAGKPGVPYGVRDYKLKFGGELVNYGRFIYIHSRVRHAIATYGYRILTKIRTIH